MIDMLILNAGVAGLPLTYTKDNFEIHVGTNHFGHVVLVESLLDKLKQQVSLSILRECKPSIEPAHVIDNHAGVFLGFCIAQACVCHSLICQICIWCIRPLSNAIECLAGWLYGTWLHDHMPCVLQASPVRIVAVSSNDHTRGFDVDDLNFRHRPYGRLTAYPQSKLCNILYIKELANRYKTLFEHSLFT